MTYYTRWKDKQPPKEDVQPAEKEQVEKRIAADAWDEAAHPRGKTTAESNDGSFRPKGPAPAGAGHDPNILSMPAVTPKGMKTFKTKEDIVREQAKLFKNKPNMLHYEKWNLGGKHKWFTRSIAGKLPRIGATKNMKPEDVKVAVKLFNPSGAGSWYITEANLDTGQAFGWADLGMGPGYSELGYMDLKELRGFRGRLGLPIERDEYFGTPTLKEVMDGRVS